MNLKLTVVSPQRAELGVAATMDFGAGGGRIGRARNNDWVLPDPQRFVSAHHARVEYRDGQYYIEDLSSNGLYLNEAEHALGRGRLQLLRDGDRLRLGPYRVVVALDREPEPHAEASSVRPIASEADFIATQGDIGVQLNVQELLRRERTGDSEVLPVDAFGQPLDSADTGLRVFDHDQNTSAKRPRLQSMRRDPWPAAADSATGAEALYKGAGIDPSALPPEAQARLLRVAGLLLREALVGLKDLMRTQRELRAEAALASPEELERDPLQGAGVEELLVRLLLGHDARQLDAVTWLRDSFAGVRHHDVAAATALRAASTQFIATLDPPLLAQRDKLPHLFLEAFGRAYAEALKKATRPA
jgi:predicted component of type VI protein secretion system